MMQKQDTGVNDIRRWLTALTSLFLFGRGPSFSHLAPKPTGAINRNSKGIG
jgi:hypothetical protein